MYSSALRSTAAPHQTQAAVVPEEHSSQCPHHIHRWHPDGNQFAVVASDLPWEWSWYSNYLALLPSEGKHQVIRQSRRQHAFPTFSPDGQKLAFLSSNWSDRGCTAGNVWMTTPSSQYETILSEGMTASFSRALTEGLTAQQPEEEFNSMLDSTIKSIFQASKT